MGVLGGMIDDYDFAHARETDIHEEKQEVSGERAEHDNVSFDEERTAPALRSSTRSENT